MSILKKMSVFLFCVIMAAGLAISASAANDTEINKKAEILNKLNIMQQSTNLNELVQRRHAATFIVRMMGKEPYVLANADKYKNTGFPDVSTTEWSAPYIGFCAEQKILGGLDNGKFGLLDGISEKAFLKISLGALGYVYGTDFNTDTIYQLAYQTGLVTDQAYLTKKTDTAKYYRKDIVTVLSNMLQAKKKGATLNVIQSLVADKIVSKDVAIACGLTSDPLKTAIESITPTSSGSITIKFNEEVDRIASTQIVINESQNVANTLAASIESVSGKEMVVNVANQAQEKGYSVQITNIIDKQGNPADVMIGSFSGYKAPEVKSDFFRIKKVEAVCKNLINVYFTHPVNANCEVAANYEILDASGTFVKGTAQTMSVKAMSSVNNGVSIYLKEKSLTEGTGYTLNISGNMSSAYGVKLNDLRGDTMTFTGKGTENEALKVTDISVKSSKVLQVEFNKEINATLAKQVFNYYVTDAADAPMAISQAVLGGEDTKKGKVVRLTMVGIFDKTKTYNLMINNINDVTRQFAIQETKFPFSGFYNEKSELAITNIIPLDTGTIALYFNKSLDIEAASLASNFIIIGESHAGYLTIPAKTVYNYDTNPYMVELCLPAGKYMEYNKSYKIRINAGLKDSFGINQVNYPDFGFTNTSLITPKPQMLEATIISSDAIKVKFNKSVALDAPNILTNNYWLEYTEGSSTSSLIPTSVNYYDSSTFILKFDSLDFNAQYTLKFKQLKDAPGLNTATQTEGLNSVVVKMGKQ